MFPPPFPSSVVGSSSKIQKDVSPWVIVASSGVAPLVWLGLMLHAKELSTFLYVNCAILADVCGVLEACQSECRPPEVLHPDSAAGPAASGSAAAPAIPGLLPLPLLRSEFLAILAGFFYCSGVGSSSFSAITSPCVERRCLTATQGVIWPTCIIRVPSVIPMGQCGSWWICRTIFPGSAASGKCCRFHLPSSCPNYHRVVGCHLAVPG